MPLTDPWQQICCAVQQKLYAKWLRAFHSLQLTRAQDSADDLSPSLGSFPKLGEPISGGASDPKTRTIAEFWGHYPRGAIWHVTTRLDSAFRVRPAVPPQPRAFSLEMQPHT